MPSQHSVGAISERFSQPCAGIRMRTLKLVGLFQCLLSGEAFHGKMRSSKPQLTAKDNPTKRPVIQATDDNAESR